MDKHTPGRWVYEESEGVVLAVDPGHGEGYHVAMVLPIKLTDAGGDTVQPASDDETRANGYVLAAAPDLLRLLKKAAPAVAELHAHDIGCPDCDDSGLHCKLVNAIEAAIRLAEPPSPEPPAPEPAK